MRMRGWIAVVWLLVPGVCAAVPPAVHQCADGQGGHLYQSMPCAPGATLRQWAIPPAPAGEGKPARIATPSVQPSPGRVATPAPGVRRAPRRSTGKASTGPHTRCLAARAERETTLARLGMKRGYADLRRLNDRVSAACNHRPAR